MTDAAREFRAWDDGSGTVAGSGLGPCARRLRWFVDADLVGLACVVDVVVVGSFGSDSAYQACAVVLAGVWWWMWG